MAAVPAAGSQAAEAEEPAKGFEWPDTQLGPRSSDRVSAGKRAAKFIACDVCWLRTLALLPGNGDIEEMDTWMREQLPEDLGDAKELCEMRTLATMFKRQKTDIKTSADG